MNLNRTLDLKLEGQGKSLITSFGAAVFCCGILCGGLGLIMISKQLFTEDPAESAEPLSISNQITKVEPPAEEPAPVPLNVISAANNPHRITYAPRSSSSPPAQEQIIPTPAVDSVVLNDLELEELDFENPFIEKKPEVIKKTQSKKASGTTVAKKQTSAPGRSDTASLAKKITRKAYPTSRATPSYPRSARRQGLEGRVVVTVTIGASGKVTNSYISKSCGHPSLDGSALSAAKRFRFSPAINGLGQAVPVKRAIPFNFQITG